MRRLDVNFRDTHLGIWQDDANDPSFRAEIYGGLIKSMRTRGWAVHQDPDVRRRYRVLSPTHRLAARGNLRAAIEVVGRVVKIEFWARTWPLENRNGRRHDFRKREKMLHLDQLRLELEVQRIVDWLRDRALVTVKRDLMRETPAQHIARSYRESWHSDPVLGRPVCKSASNSKSAEGATLEHGATVWFSDRKGRICRGTAFYNINNMWWVVAGGELRNLGSHELWVSAPRDLRKRRNDRDRRRRLEEELAKAIRAMDFDRAKILKVVLFGEQPVYQLWARDKQAYYRANYEGYTTDVVSAGRYTRSEAERECRRVPSEVELVAPDGRRERFDKVAA